VKRASLYSKSRPKPVAVAVPGSQATVKKPHTPWRGWLRQNRLTLLVAVPGIMALAVLLAQRGFAPVFAPTTQEDVDAAVARSLETLPLPSHSSKAFEAVRGSIVRVRGFVDGPDGAELQNSVGTGVVILDQGVILTNIHVVEGAKRISLVFADGMEADAVVTGTRPEDDLAVLQASAIPDDLQAATLQSTSGLAPGDYVTAVGFPFGLGPSVSAGVVSGLKREYRTPGGKRLVTNLIQFDAAVNPGSSGGALLNASGEVVGIVTGILNPTEQRVFVGIGFAVPIENAASAVGVPPF